MWLATEHPGGLFDSEPGWRLPNQRQESLLIVFHRLGKREQQVCPAPQLMYLPHCQCFEDNIVFACERVFKGGFRFQKLTFVLVAPDIGQWPHH